MTDPLVELSDGSTPIDDDEADGLLLSWVRTRRDLNEAEAANIDSARQRLGRATLDDVTDDLWLRRLHALMFGEVWRWAGRYRRTERNIGIDPVEITAAVRMLCDDCRTWSEFAPGRATVARFHHRLVAIHPFPNGNGRHARACADHLCEALGLPAPTWGAGAFIDVDSLRSTYLRALRRADVDGDDLEPLVEFMWGSRAGP